MPNIRAILIGAAWLLTTVPAFGQEEVRTIPFKGPHIVCHILHSLDLKPTATYKDAATNPEDTMIIVLGDPRAVDEIRRATGGLRRFLDKGGNLLIATDRRFDAPDLGIRITGELVQVPDDLKKLYAYGDKVECPTIPLRKPIRGAGDPNIGFPEPAAVPDHPIFSLLHRPIATNWPSRIEVLRNHGSLTDLMMFPFGFGDVLGIPVAPPRYMVGSPKKTGPRGRTLYIAGHGMFMNGMMLQDDNDNFAFTISAMKWLREGPKQTNRTHALLIVDGEIITDFDMNLTPPPSIPMPPVKVFGKLIRGLEDERWFHKTVADALGSRLGLVCAIIAGIATFVLLMYGAKKFLAGRHHLETKVPALLGPQPAMAPTASVEERRQAILHQADYWEEARFLVLKWFRQELDVTPNRWLESIDARFQADGFFWSRWRLQRQANYVLRLAQIDKPLRVSRHDFFVLFETLRDLGGALQDGRLALLVGGKNVKQFA